MRTLLVRVVVDLCHNVLKPLMKGMHGRIEGRKPHKIKKCGVSSCGILVALKIKIFTGRWILQADSEKLCIAFQILTARKLDLWCVSAYFGFSGGLRDWALADTANGCLVALEIQLSRNTSMFPIWTTYMHITYSVDSWLYGLLDSLRFQFTTMRHFITRSELLQDRPGFLEKSKEKQLLHCVFF